MGKHLSQGEKEYIFNSAGSATDKDVAAKLSELRGSTVNKEVVGAFRRRSGLTKTRGRNSKLLVAQVKAVDVGAAVETSVSGEASA